MNRHRRTQLIREVEAYLAFYAIVRPSVAPPPVHVGSRRLRRRINAYGITS